MIDIYLFMNSPKLFKITKKDIAKYQLLIDKIDLNQKTTIIEVLGLKIQKILDDGNLNVLEIKLIEDMASLVQILEFNQNLPKKVIKMVLFAMSYFIDENDEIPDIIPEYGYLDDITVVSWVMEEIQQIIPEITRA